MTQFKPHVKLDLESSRYLVKSAETWEEVTEACKLRHEVFFVEQLGRKLPSGLDTDDFDAHSDHLLIIERKSGRIIGNYRIRCSVFTDNFYSAQEFTIERFLKEVPDAKIEIGRACVDKDHRNGVVIHLLWKGIVQYMKQTRSRYMFGCTSVSNRVPGEVQAVWDYLSREGKITSEFDVKPRIPFVLKSASQSLPSAEVAIPPLLASYLKSGAKILGAPAFDEEFECADFLTLLDLKDVGDARSRRYELEVF